tara:strand:- start:884 stop:2014 length:1131 start_codon:yes stop_codon:yes gene_type:complete
MQDKEWDELKLIQEKLHEALDKGYPPTGKGGQFNPKGAKQIVSEVLDIPRTTLQRRINQIEKLALGSSHWAIEWHRYKQTKPQYIIEEYKKPVIRITAHQTDFSKSVKVFVIPDAHDSPDKSKERFYWIGCQIKEYQPDHIVCIGDWSNFDSLANFSAVKNWTKKGQSKPNILQDIISSKEALNELYRGMGDYECSKHYCIGNHELRIYRYENEHPEVVGAFSQQYENIWRSKGWGISKYGDFYFIKGVGFVHCPLNELGREYGGRLAEASQISNMAMHDIVFGHSHKERSWRASKIGRGNYVKIVNVGTCLEYGEIEDYALNNVTGWSYGITQLTIADAHIISHNQISMIELKEKYGNERQISNTSNEQTRNQGE